MAPSDPTTSAIRLRKERLLLCHPQLAVKKTETIATLPGGWDLAHAIRLGIKPFAELGANSEALSGSQVDSPCSCRAIFEIGPGSDATVSENVGFLCSLFPPPCVSDQGQSCDSD